MTGLFDSIFGTATTISVQEFLICIAVSLIIGVFLALVYAFRSKYTQSFLVTLALIPAVVCVLRAKKLSDTLMNTICSA